MEPFATENELEELARRFADRSLPASEWTHRAHLSVAYWYLSRYSLEEAICYLRSGIITYNVASGGENRPDKGYHETLTLFWIKTVYDFIQQQAAASLLQGCNAFLASHFTSSHYPLSLYSRELLFSTRARAFWVAPDLLEEEARRSWLSPDVFV